MNKPQLKTVIQATEETKKKGYSIPEGFIGKMSIVFAQEEYNEHIRNVIENALEIAAKEANLKERRKTYKCSSGIEYGYIKSVDKKSITKTLEQTFEKWKI